MSSPRRSVGSSESNPRTDQFLNPENHQTATSVDHESENCHFQALIQEENKDEQ